MKPFDSIGRLVILAQGTGSRWLREELDAAGVTIPMTDGCLSEFVRAADATIRAGHSGPYVQRLREMLATQANFILRWTGSDENLSHTAVASVQELVRIAHKYALPRRWKLSEPVVTEYRRLRPSDSKWTDDLDTDALPQA